MFSKMQCPNSRSKLRKSRQKRCLLRSLPRMFPASLAGLRKTSVSAICFTLNPNKGHHLRHLGHTCSSIRSKATWVMVIHQFYGYIWHLAQIRTLTPLHHECEDWYLDSRCTCSIQYALCQKWHPHRYILLAKKDRRGPVDLNITPAWHGARSQGLTKPNNSDRFSWVWIEKEWTK